MSKNKNASAASNRTRVKNVRGAKKELAAGEMKKVKGGLESAAIQGAAKPSNIFDDPFIVDVNVVKKK